MSVSACDVSIFDAAVLASDWAPAAPCVYLGSGAPLRLIAADATRPGALRYRCPAGGSFVLLTDATSLSALRRGLGRVQCPACREEHLIGAIVAAPVTV